VDAIVSLCRVRDTDLRVGVEQIDVRLIDDDGPDSNPNLEFVLTDCSGSVLTVAPQVEGVALRQVD
jgi:hypothetical protein